MEATTITLKDMATAAARVRSAVESDLPIAELAWLLPVDFVPGATELFGCKVHRVTGLDRPYLAHNPGDVHESPPLGDPTSAETAYDVVARAMEKWIEDNYRADFFPDGRRGARGVVQALLDLGWRPPSELTDEEISLHVRDNGGPGNGIIATVVDGDEKLFPLPTRGQKVTLAQIRDGLR